MIHDSKRYTVHSILAVGECWAAILSVMKHGNVPVGTPIERFLVTCRHEQLVYSTKHRVMRRSTKKTVWLD